MIQPVRIGNRLIGPGHPCFIIAEAGVNHNGNLEMAKRLVDLAAECHVDAIKFQTFVTDNVKSRSALKPSYFSGRESTTDKREFSRSLELTTEEFHILKERAQSSGLVFLSTACDTRALDILLDIGVDALKIGSSDTNNFPLLEKAAHTLLPIILSTGISTLQDVQESVKHLRSSHCQDLVLLQCTSSYPIAPKDVCMRVMNTYVEHFQLPVGFSDHTEGTWAAVAAAALGASTIEKHFTISRNLPGVDHPASLEPQEMARLVCEVRYVEAAMGNGRKEILPVEREHLVTMRKSLVAAADLAPGTELSPDKLLVKRPGGGIPPNQIGNVLGRRLKLEVGQDDLLTWDKIE